MDNIFDMIFTLGQVTGIFKLGFVPEDEELYELTPEQYEAYYATNGDEDDSSDEKIYMLLPKDAHKYNEVASGDVYVLTESDIELMRRAAQIIENYCKNSKKKFKNYDEKLRYCASVMPESISKGTKYEIYSHRKK